MRKSIKRVLMERDGKTEEQAEQEVQQLRNRFYTLLREGRLMEAYEVCYEVGLEPDYVEELAM